MCNPDSRPSIIAVLRFTSFTNLSIDCKTQGRSRNRSGLRVSLMVLLVACLGLTAPGAMAQTAAHFSGVQSVVAASMNASEGIAVDASGNLYIASASDNRVLKLPFTVSGYGAPTVVVSGLNNPQAVAVDASGSKLYVADTNNNQVLEETLSGSSYTQTAVVLDNSTLVSGTTLLTPQGVAVDVLGNVYISDTGRSRVLKVMCTLGTCGAATIVADSSVGLSYPMGVAVDATGNVYIADFSNDRWVKESWNTTAYTQSYTSGPLDSAPTGIAVDAKGNIYFDKSGSGKAWVTSWTSGDFYGPTMPIGSNLNNPTGIAVDVSGNIFIFDTGLNKVFKETLSGGGNLGAVNVGSPSSTPATLIFTFDAAGTIGSPQVSTQGASGLDFMDGGSGSCAALGTSHPYSVGDTCTVDVNFTPKFPGTRYGGVLLTDGSGNALATGYVLGTGSGPQMNFMPGSQGTISTGSPNNASGIAVDASGNIYVTYSGSSLVDKLVATGGSNPAVVPLGGGLNDSHQIAVDGAGNVFVADAGNNSVKEIPPGCLNSACVVTLGGGFLWPTGLAVDGRGNLFVADTFHDVVKEIPVGCFDATCVLGPLGNGFNRPQSVAVDASGNVFVADGSQSVREIVAFDGLVSGASAVKVVGSGFSNPKGVAVDGRGNVFVTDWGSDRVAKEIIAVGGVVSDTSTVVTLGSNFQFPDGVAVDGAGNLYIADNFTTNIIKLDFADAPTLSFPTAHMGSTSSAQTVTLLNIGNTDLFFTVPTAGNNPSIGPDFSLITGGVNACTVLSSDSGPVLLPAGNTCQFSVSFKPVTTGNKSEAVTLTDDNLNRPGDTQTMNLTGTANVGVATVTLSNLEQTYNGSPKTATVTTVPGNLAFAITYDGSATVPTNAGSYAVEATVSDPNYTGTQTGTLVISQAQAVIEWATPGSILYGTALSATQLNATTGVAGTFEYLPALGYLMSAGPDQTILCIFTPTDTVNYVTVLSKIVKITVDQATPSVVWATPASIAYGSPLGTTQLNATSGGVAGNFVYSPSAGAVLTAGSQTLSVVFTPDNTTNYATATASTTLAVSKATPTVNWAVPSAITYSTALSSTQLNANSSVAGTLVYSPVDGTVLGAGSQALSVTFMPADISNYTTATASTTVVVSKATPTVNWAVPSAITYSTALSDTQLNATSSVAGTLVYSPVAGTVLSAGNQTLSVTFTPTDRADYASAASATTTTITVNKATASATPNMATKAYGATDPTFSGTLDGFAPGDNVTASYSRIPGETVAGGPYAISATLTPSVALANYIFSSSTANMTITKALPVAAWAAPAPIIYGTALSSAQLNATSGGVAGTFVYTPAAGAMLGGGSRQALSASFVPTDSTNYSPTTVVAAITVTKATASAVVTSSANPVLVLNEITLTARVSLASFAPTGIVIFLDGTTSLGSATLTNGIAMLTTSSLAAGSHSISVAYGGDENFVATTSSGLTQMAADFALTSTSGNNSSSATVQPGGKAAYLLTFTPTDTSMWPAAVTLSASGLPVGATATFSPQTLAAGSNTTAVTMTVQTSRTSASLYTPDGMERHLAPLALALLLLPFGKGLRRAGMSLGRMISVCLLLAISMVAIAGLSGCGTATNSSTQNPMNYTVTVTATSGALSHTTTVALTVE